MYMSQSSPQSYEVKTEETGNKLDLSSNYRESSGHSFDLNVADFIVQAFKMNVLVSGGLL